MHDDGHDALIFTRQPANPPQDISLENLSQQLQLHVFQFRKLACLRSCMRQLHYNQLHGKRVGGRAQLLNYGLLVIGYWLLVIGYGLLVIGYWLLVIGYWLWVIDYGLLIIGYRLLIIGY